MELSQHPTHPVINLAASMSEARDSRRDSHPHGMKEEAEIARKG